MMEKNTILAIFAVTMTVTYRPIHIGGTTAPCYICRWERKFQGAKVPGCESSRERKFQGAKVPHLELSLPGANGLGSEKSIIRFRVTVSVRFRCRLANKVSVRCMYQSGK